MGKFCFLDDSLEVIFGLIGFALTFAQLIQKDGGIGPCDVLATGALASPVLLSTTAPRG